MAKSTRSQLPIIILGCLIGGLLFGWALVFLVPKESLQWMKPKADWETVPYLAIAFLMALAALATHELGHLLAGLAVGFRFSLFIVGPLGIRRNEDDKVEVYFNRDLASYGGMAAAQPSAPRDDLRARFAAYVAAGPLVSLLIGIVAILIVKLSDTSAIPISATKRYVLLTIMVYGLMNFAIFLATTIPSRTGPFYTDRARLVRLLWPGNAATEEMAMIGTMAHISAGGCPSQISRDTIRDLVVTPDDPSISAFYFAYLACMARGEFESALPLLASIDKKSESLGDAARDIMLTESVFGYAVAARDKKKTHAVWEQVSEAHKRKETIGNLRTKHAIAWLWGEREMDDRIAALKQKADSLGPQMRSAELALVNTFAKVIAKSRDEAPTKA